LAKLLFTAFLNSASGKLAGSTFSKSIVRTRNNFSVRQSLASQYYRNQYIYASKLWRTLTPAERNSWKALAKQEQVFGSAFSDSHKTPFFLFVHTNYYRILNLTGIALTAPAMSAAPVFSNFIIIPRTSTGQLFIRVEGPVTVPNPRVNYYLSPPLPPGKSAYKRNLRLIQFNSFGGTSTGDCTVIYNAYFGALPPIGSYIFGGIRFFDSEYLQPTKLHITSAIAF